MRELVLGVAAGIGAGTLIAMPAAADLLRGLAVGLVIGGGSVFLVTRYLSKNDECTEGEPMTSDELISQVWDTELQEYYRYGGSTHDIDEKNPSTYSFSTSIQWRR